MNKVIFFLISVLLFSCSNSKTVPEENELTPASANTLKTIALDRIGPNYVTEFNPDSSFALVKNPNKNRPFVSGVFFVYDVNAEKVILEDVMMQAQIKWSHPFELEVVSVPGIVRGDESDQRPKGYRFDVKRRTRTSLVK